MGVVQEVTHKLQVKTKEIKKGSKYEKLKTHSNAGAPAPKVAEEAVS